MDTGQAVVERISKEIGRTGIRIVRGLVQSVSYGTTAGNVIQIDDATITNVPVTPGVHLLPGMSVNILRSLDAKSMLIVGEVSADAQPVQGTVQSVGSTTCVVLVPYSSGTRTMTLPWIGSTPVVGNVVLLQWVSGTAVVLGKLSQSLPSSLTPPYVPPTSPVTPPSSDGGSSTPVATPTSGQTVFTATDSRTCKFDTSILYGDAAWQTGDSVKVQKVKHETDPYIGDNDVMLGGGYWYGSKIDNFINTVTTVTKVEAFLACTDGTTFKIGYGLNSSRPTAWNFAHADAPQNPKNIAVGTGTSGWYQLNSVPITGCGELIVLYSSGTGALKGISSNSQAGAIRVSWTKNP